MSSLNKKACRGRKVLGEFERNRSLEAAKKSSSSRSSRGGRLLLVKESRRFQAAHVLPRLRNLPDSGRSQRRPTDYPGSHRELKTWPYRKNETVKLFVLAGHRNMEGERSFVQEVENRELLKDDPTIAFKYNLGGGYRVSRGWESLGPTGYYDTFGPELSFARAYRKLDDGPLAIAKFTHSGSQIIDWTPEGSVARSRNLYPRFIAFVNESLAELRARGQKVQLAGIVYHVGENDMSFSPYRRRAAERLKAIVEQSRHDLKRPGLNWFISQQPPTDDKRVNKIDVTTAIREWAAEGKNVIHIKAFDLPAQPKKLVINTAGIIKLGELLGREVVKHSK